MPQRDICSALPGQGAAPQPPPPPRSAHDLTAAHCPRATAGGARHSPRPATMRAMGPGQSCAARKAPPQGSHGSAPQLNVARRGPGTIQQHPCARLCPVQEHPRGVTPDVPVGLRFLQELHLVLHAGARLQLLHHHLGAADARVHLPQEHLGRGTGSSPPSSPQTHAQPSPRCQHPTGVSPGDPIPAAHLAEPAVPDLLQVEQALPPQVRRLEELHCNRAHPAACAPSCPPARPPSLPAVPAAPGRAPASPPCHPVPGPAPPRGAPGQPPQQPSPGTLRPGHPPGQASCSHAGRGDAGYRCPQIRWQRRAGSLPLLLLGEQGERSRAQRELWHLVPSWLPPSLPGTGPAPRTPMPGVGSNGAIVGLRRLAPRRPRHTAAILRAGERCWAGGGCSQAPPTFLSHSQACLRGTGARRYHSSGCPVSRPTPVVAMFGAGDRPPVTLAQRDSGSAPQGPQLTVPCPRAAPDGAGAPLGLSILSRGGPTTPIPPRHPLPATR